MGKEVSALAPKSGIIQNTCGLTKNPFRQSGQALYRRLSKFENDQGHHCHQKDVLGRSLSLFISEKI